jgi:hypothetical protein
MCHPPDIRSEALDTQVESLSIFANGIGKAVVQAPC